MRLSAAQKLFGDHRHVVCHDVYLALDEVTIAAALNNTVTQHPAVTIGSYPELLHRSAVSQALGGMGVPV